MLFTSTLTLLVGLCLLGAGVHAADVVEALMETDIINRFDNEKYQNCDEVRNKGPYKDSGTYFIFPNTTEPIWVYCRFEAKATVTSIMGQKFGQQTFYRGWNDYKYGFGSPSQGDYWIGLKAMKQVADGGSRVLTIVMQDWNNVIQTIQYKSFFLDSESNLYRLRVSGYQGALLDDLSYNNGMYFATYDMPDRNGCAKIQKAGWWYNDCSTMLPTGHYYVGGPYTPPGTLYDGIYYKDWQGYGYSLKYIRMDLSKQ